MNSEETVACHGLHRQKCGSFESAITMSCGRLTMEANGKITKKVYGD